jgi:broad-specificity NMP kinase
VWNLVSHIKKSRQAVSENRVVKERFDLRGMKRQKIGENCLMSSSMVDVIHQTLLGRLNQDRMDRVCRAHGEIRNVHKISV